LIIPLLSSAVAQFKKYKSPRMKRYLSKSIILTQRSKSIILTQRGKSIILTQRRKQYVTKRKFKQ
jgi:hypothetical protein